MNAVYSSTLASGSREPQVTRRKLRSGWAGGLQGGSLFSTNPASARLASRARGPAQRALMGGHLAVESQVPGPAIPLPEADDVLEELERVLASGDFDASPRSRAFLRHIVEETLAGRQAGLPGGDRPRVFVPGELAHGGRSCGSRRAAAAVARAVYRSRRPGISSDRVAAGCLRARLAAGDPGRGPGEPRRCPTLEGPRGRLADRPHHQRDGPELNASAGS
jgi:hypothetical protein